MTEVPLLAVSGVKKRYGATVALDGVAVVRDGVLTAVESITTLDAGFWQHFADPDVGAAGGGVWRTEDGGKTWDAKNIVEVFDMAIRGAEQFPGGSAADWSSLPPLNFASRDTLIMGGGLPALMSGSPTASAAIFCAAAR